MEFKVEVLKMEDGRRIALLQKDGIPMYYPSLYITTRKRNSSYNTQRNIQQHIKLLQSWCEIEGVVLEKRFSNGEELSGRECLSLIDFCAWDSDTIKRMRSGIRMLSSAYTEVGREEASTRVINIKGYLEFLFRRLTGCGDDDPRLAAMLKDLESQMPRVKKFRQIDVVELTKHQEAVLKEKIMPKHPDNPWPGLWEVRVRNLLIVHLLFETGMRRSELAALHVSDVDIDGCSVSIYRRHDNREDDRRQQPNAKTGERTLPLSRELVEQIYKYQVNIRAKIQVARRHPFLFVAHRRNEGKAISLNTINKVFSSLSSTFPELGRLYPHKLRHHWNFDFTGKAEEELKHYPADQREVMIEQMRNHLMGWSSNSKMGALYNRRATEEKARAILEKRASKFRMVQKENNHAS
ncbi:site-specific integrase [uncultured Marinobacter sp.]|uniref:tyrosine-type recombinase/integrase n=1 Tax=uncultured Marinobacter sp. TaxID=187379 RepID=UPI0025EE127F|nr:site-specific integrase [uncultured Marinobacter sp.]